MRFPVLTLALVLAFSAAACSPAKTEAPAPYADLKAVYEGVIDAEEQLANGLAAANDGKKVAQALKNYTAKMRELAPKLNATQAKYPEMANAATPPEELTLTIEALNASTNKMMEALAKVQTYMDDADVVAAMDDLTRAAQQAQQR